MRAHEYDRGQIVPGGFVLHGRNLDVTAMNSRLKAGNYAREGSTRWRSSTRSSRSRATWMQP